MKRNLRFVFALILALVLVTALGAPAFAAAGQEVFADGRATGSYDGSLFVAGQAVESAANVDGVQLAAGSSVSVDGESGHLLAAGYNVTMSPMSMAEKEAFLAGYAVAMNGSVGRDLFLAGNAVTVGGQVGRNVYASGGSVTLAGTVGGDLYLSADNIVIAETAQIGGKLHYNSNAAISAPAVLLANADVYAGAENEEEEAAAASDGGSRIPGILLSYLGVVALAFVLLWLTPLWETVDRKYYGAPLGKYATAYGIGFAVLVGLPVAAILLMITQAGVRLAFVLLMLYVAAILAAPVFFGFFVGALLWRRALRRARCYWAELPLGLLIWRVMVSVPGLSFVTGLVVIPLGIGVAALLLEKKKSVPPAAAAPATDVPAAEEFTAEESPAADLPAAEPPALPGPEEGPKA